MFYDCPVPVSDIHVVARKSTCVVAVHYCGRTPHVIRLSSSSDRYPRRGRAVHVHSGGPHLRERTLHVIRLSSSRAGYPRRGRKVRVRGGGPFLWKYTQMFSNCPVSSDRYPRRGREVHVRGGGPHFCGSTQKCYPIVPFQRWISTSWQGSPRAWWRSTFVWKDT